MTKDLQPPEHDANHGEAHEGDDGPSVALEISRQARCDFRSRQRAIPPSDDRWRRTVWR